MFFTDKLLKTLTDNQNDIFFVDQLIIELTNHFSSRVMYTRRLTIKFVYVPRKRRNLGKTQTWDTTACKQRQ